MKLSLRRFGARAFAGGRVFARRAGVLGGPAGALGEYHLEGGVLSTPLLGKRLGKRGNGAGFDFTGGRLQAGIVNLDLTVNGGVLAPGWHRPHSRCGQLES